MSSLSAWESIQHLSEEVTAYDMIGSYDSSRRWREKKSPSYKVRGVFQTAAPQTRMPSSYGSKSEGSAFFWSLNLLFIQDNNPLQGLENKQSYLEKNGERWRIQAKESRKNDGGYFKYICQKY